MVKRFLLEVSESVGEELEIVAEGERSDVQWQTSRLYSELAPPTWGRLSTLFEMKLCRLLFDLPPRCGTSARIRRRTGQKRSERCERDRVCPRARERLGDIPLSLISRHIRSLSLSDTLGLSRSRTHSVYAFHTLAHSVSLALCVPYTRARGHTRSLSRSQTMRSK